jgi:DNA-binding transcriptional ArsR family regulator
MRGEAEEWHPERWLQGVADPIRLAILRILGAVEQATAGDLARLCQASRRTLERHLEAMVAIGIVEEKRGESDGLRTGRPPTSFSLSPPIQDSVRELLNLRASGQR